MEAPRQSEPTVKLSAYFSAPELVRDAEFRWTLHPEATSAGAVCYGLHEAVLRRIQRNPQVSAVLTTRALAQFAAPEVGLVLTDDPQKVYYDLHNRLAAEGRLKPHDEESIDPTADVAPTAVLGRHVVIGPRVRVGHGVVLHDFTMLGEGTTVAEYAIVGARGMQNIRVQGRFYPVEWTGGVRVGRGCEILAAAVVQRPYHCEYTEIGDEARISVKVTVGHRSIVGTRAMIGGNAQIGGNVRIGSDAWIGQGSVICDGLRIGDRADVKMGSVVVANVGDDEAVSGNFALRHERQVQLFTEARRG
jgi:UDP-3-O-[3-hydroxymyristoyl] glucosamine N-acyltransferase